MYYLPPASKVIGGALKPVPTLIFLHGRAPLVAEWGFEAPYAALQKSSVKQFTVLEIFGRSTP